MATGDEVVTGEAVTLDVRPAGFGLRALSALIDWVIYLALYLLSLLAVVGLANQGLIDDAAFAALQITSLVVAFVGLPLVIELVGRGKSIGRLALGLRIVRDDGGGIRFRHALVRSLTGAVEIAATVGGLAAMVSIVSPKGKRVGDWLAGTYSQQERLPRMPAPAPPLPLGLEGWASVADVARMPDRTARRLASFVQQAGAMDAGSRRRMADVVAAEAAAYVAPWPPVPADVALIAISAVRREREARRLAGQRARRQALAPQLERLPQGFPDR